MRTIVLLVGIALSLSVRIAHAEETVPVLFVADDIESSVIQVDGTRCRTPCTLSLTPGPHEVTVLDSRHSTRNLFVPEVPSIVRLQDTHRGLLIAGSVLLAVGTLAIPAWAWLLQPFQCAPGDWLCPAFAGLFKLWGVLGTVLTVQLDVAGIVMLGVWGAHPPTTDLVAEPLTDKTPSLKLTSIGLMPVRDGFGAGLGFSF